MNLDWTKIESLSHSTKIECSKKMDYPILIDLPLMPCLHKYGQSLTAREPDPPERIPTNSFTTYKINTLMLFFFYVTCRECSIMMVGFHQKAGTGKLTGVYRKYCSAKFSFTAKCEPACFLLENNQS